MKQYTINETIEFKNWIEIQSLKTKVIISDRIKKIKEHGHFGDHRNVSFADKGITKDRIFELKWSDGKRVYYGLVDNKIILLLCGGNKNGQQKDINKAKRIFTENIED